MIACGRPGASCQRSVHHSFAGLGGSGAGVCVCGVGGGGSSGRESDVHNDRVHAFSQMSWKLREFGGNKHDSARHRTRGAGIL